MVVKTKNFEGKVISQSSGFITEDVDESKDDDDSEESEEEVKAEEEQ